MAQGPAGCSETRPGAGLCVGLSVLQLPTPPPSLAGLHLLGLPGALQEARGAEAAHGVAHWGDALQGQQHRRAAAGMEGEGQPGSPRQRAGRAGPGSPSLSWPVLPGGSSSCSREALRPEPRLCCWSSPCTEIGWGALGADSPVLPCSAPPAPSSSCRRRTCRAT